MGRSTVFSSLRIAWKAIASGASAKHMVIATAITAILSLTACRHSPEKSAELWLGGDVSLGDGGEKQLQDIAGLVKGTAGIVNLEGPISERLPNRDHLRLWNAPAALAELSGLNVRIAGIANNHSLDAGAVGSEQTIKALRNHGILPAGGTAGAAVLEFNGLVIAVTTTDLTPGVTMNLGAGISAARPQSAVSLYPFHH